MDGLHPLYAGSMSIISRALRPRNGGSASTTLSDRPASEPRPPTPAEELPDWVMSSVLSFLEPFFQGHGPAAYGISYMEGMQRDFIREVERTCQIPVRWDLGRNGAANSVWQAMYRDRALAVKVIDYSLGDVMLGYDAQGMGRSVAELDRALKQAGANYVVVLPDERRASYRLERRTIPAAAAAARAQMSVHGNASDHLDNAWKAAFGREPNPTLAYGEAVKAVEAAAIPVVLPNDSTATLGKVVGELRANPQKYSVVFSRDAEPAKGVTLSPLEVVIGLTDSLWSNQTDRHPPGDPQPPVPVTQAQAEMAVNVAVALVHTFRSAIT
jgi:hypothetical protein